MMTTTALLRCAFRNVALLALLALSTLGCQWAPSPVPADPGLNARARGGPGEGVVSAYASARSANDADPEAGRIYARHCARCHELKAPSSHFADEWPRYVRRYGPRAGLHGADRARVLRWLQSHAAR